MNVELTYDIVVRSVYAFKKSPAYQYTIVNTRCIAVRVHNMYRKIYE